MKTMLLNTTVLEGQFDDLFIYDVNQIIFYNLVKARVRLFFILKKNNSEQCFNFFKKN